LSQLPTAHIVQFAALLRDRRIVRRPWAVLFDNRRRELGPTFPGHSLFTIEIMRTFEGKPW
jgi:hypothetical protein